EPSMVKGLSLTADYWWINVNQTLGAYRTPTILGECYPASLTGVAANQPQNTDFCKLITRSTNTGAVVNVSDLEQNTGSLWTSGLDVAVHYTLPTDFGRFGVVIDGTWLGRYDNQLLAGTPFVKTYHSAGNYDDGSGTAISCLTPKIKLNFRV